MTLAPQCVRLAEAVVVHRADITDDLMKLWLEPPEGFTFKPGQYCTIGIDGTERPYSIVSSPLERYIELFIELIPKHVRTERSLTPKLWKLGEGDTVTIRPKAKGLLQFDTRFGNQIMVATVTGIAPFVSMLRSYALGYYRDFDYNHRIFVFHGASYHDEFTYNSELERLGFINAYVPTVSRPDEERNSSWRGVCGRVNDILLEHLRAFRVWNLDSIVYLCGNAGMIEKLGNRGRGKPLGRLVEAGFKNIKEEAF